MARNYYTASYVTKKNNFFIDGIPEEVLCDKTLLSFISVLKNLLQRKNQVAPSTFLQDKLGHWDLIQSTTQNTYVLPEKAAFLNWETSITRGGNSKAANHAVFFDVYLP